MKWGRRLKRSVLAIGLGLFFAVLGSGSVVQAQEPDYGTMYIFSGGEIKGFQTAYLNSIPEENGYKYVDIVIPDSINGTAVTAIGDSAFLGSKSEYANVKVRHIDLSNAAHLIDIKKWAFYAFGSMYTEMEPCTLTFPQTLVTIGNNAFSGQKTLTGSLDIPDSVTLIDDSAFMGCGFNGTLKLPSNPQFTEIKQQIFKDCSFTGTLTIPEAVTVISSNGNYAFSGNQFTEVILNNNITKIGGSAFNKCEQLLKVRVSGKPDDYSVVLPDALTELKNMVFQYCSSLEGCVKLPDALASIGSQMFQDTRIGTIYMPNNENATYSSNFLQSTTVNAAVFPTKELYDKYAGSFSSSSREYFSYPVTVTYLGKDEAVLGKRDVLYNRPLNYHETENGWEEQADFTFPETGESEAGYDTGFSFTKGGKVAGPKDVVTGTTLYFSQSLSKPEVTFQEVKNKTYDGKTEYIRCEASHPLAGEDGQYAFLYCALKGNSNSFFYVSEEPFEYPITDVKDSMRYVCYVQMYDRAHPEYQGKWSQSAWYDYFATYVTISKADPVVTPSCKAKALEGTRMSDILLELSQGDTPGTLSVANADATIGLGENILSWTFEPEDTDNYNTGKTGQITITGVEKAEAQDVKDSIEKLPDTVESAQDARDVLNAWKEYSSLAPEEKEALDPALKHDILHKISQVPGVEVKDETAGSTAKLMGGQEERLLGCMTGEEADKLLDGTIEKYVVVINSKETQDIQEEIWQSVAGVLEDHECGVHYDITMEKQLYEKSGDAEPVLREAVTQLPLPIKIAFAVPENLKAPQGMAREYAIFRTHGQEGGFSSVRLETECTEEAIYAETGQFSIYTLAYKDRQVPEEGIAPGNTPGGQQATGTGRAPAAGKVAVTGDESPKLLYLGLVILAAVIIIGIIVWNKKNRKR